MQLAHIVIAILFTLGVDAVALRRFLRWTWQKAIGVAVLLNVASLISAFFAQSYIMARIPASWFFIYNLYTRYAAVVLPFILLAFLVKVVTEWFICTFFEKSAPTKTIWAVVAGMNLVTMLPGAVHEYVRSRPEIPKPYVLLPSADWLGQLDEDVYFFDTFARRLVAVKPGSTNFTVLTSSPPVRGYRIACGGAAVITLHPTNAVTISLLAGSDKPARSYTYPIVVDNPALIDVSPEARFFAVCDAGSVKCYGLSSGGRTGEATRVSIGTDGYVAWTTNSSMILCGTRDGAELVEWQAGVTQACATVAPTTPVSWVCSLDKYLAPTNVFVSPVATVEVIRSAGLEIHSDGKTDKFTVSAAAGYVGIGFLSDNETFLFQLGREIMALNVRTKTVGHLYEGILCTLQRPRYEVPTGVME